jgi:hypothetical protein
MKTAFKNILIVLLYLTVGCLEPYKIPNSSYQDFLVVEGFLSSALDNHQVKLSRTSPNNQRRIIPENSADVWIEASSGGMIKLKEIDNGTYQSDSISGVIGTVYKLFINTKDGRQYSSESVKLREVPSIDSIYGRYLTEPDGTNGVQIYVDAKGGAKESRHYRWNYFETYEIHSPRPSLFVWLGGNNVSGRTVPIDVCWRTDTLKNILIASAQNFSENTISGFPVRFISSESFQLQVKYHMRLRQYSLSDQGFLFWSFLKTISDGQGSLFDIQPGKVPGNITSLTDSSEPVLGYFDASEVSEKQIFLLPEQFHSEGFRSAMYEASCNALTPNEVPINEIESFFDSNGTENYIISDATGLTPNVSLIIYPRICCDCTVLGTNVKPFFWK